MADPLSRELLNIGTRFRDESYCILSNLEPIAPFVPDRPVHACGIVNERMRVQNPDHPLLEVIHAMQVIAQLAKMRAIQSKREGIDREVAPTKIVGDTALF